MSVSFTGDVITNALWPQGDERDPLGVWGSRVSVTADATGNEIKGNIQVSPGAAAAYVYTLYDFNLTQRSGTLNTNPTMLRMLATWPNMGVTAGVQGYSTARFGVFRGSASFDTAPVAGEVATDELLPRNSRFILLFDPRPGPGILDLLEIKLVNQTDLDIYDIECYGYYWDRSVLNAPGGPRHPGSS